MGPVAIAMLASGGLNIMGGLSDINKINEQNKIEQATNNANAAVQRAEIAKNYTGIFDKMVSDLGTQVSVFATAKVDKSSTLFSKGMQEHEKAFLDNKANMESDIHNINVQRDLSNYQSKLTAINNKQKVGVDMVSGALSSWQNYNQYQLNRNIKVQGINGK